MRENSARPDRVIASSHAGPLRLAAVVCLTAFAARVARVGNDDFLATWGDDFYYYLKIAMNVVDGRGSTFDGELATNGYHPLWMLCLIGLVALFGSGKLMMSVLAAVAALSIAATSFFAHRLAAWAIGVDGLLAAVIGLYTAVFAYKVGAEGMEVLLAVPFALYLSDFLIRNRERLESTRCLLLLGLTCALLTLSRLDAVLFVALVTGAYVVVNRPSIAELLRVAGLFAIGFIPVGIYIATNLLFFRGLLPVSGAAKELAHWPILEIFNANLLRRPGVFELCFYYPSIFVLVGGLILTAYKARELDVFERWCVAFPLLAFPPLYYGAQAVLSDWELGRWYYYALVVSTPVGAGLVLAWLRRALALTMPRLIQALDFPARELFAGRCGTLMWIPSIGLPVVFGAYNATHKAPAYPSYVFARVLEEFAKTHPGRYAMGDRAGAAGYLLPHSLLQLEGLVEDRQYLDHIRRQDDLVKVLEERNIEYYAASWPIKDGDCFKTLEPFKGGRLSPRMSGRFCQKPILIHEHEEDGTVTYVFHLKSVNSMATPQ